MSVFKVKLQNKDQGQMDIDPTTGLPFVTSIQRTMYVAGPKSIYRKLADGATFTDCNYWKRFAYPQVSLADSFIEVVTDDGSVYSDNPDENTYAVVFGGESAYTILTTDTFADKYIDILGTYGSFASFVQIENYGTASPGNDIKIQLSGSSAAVMKLKSGDTQVFNSGDLQITKLAFQGGSSNTDIQVIISIKVVCNS